MNAEPKEGESFRFNSTLEFQIGNKKANELGLRARIEDVWYNHETDDKMLAGTWIKDETPAKRS